MAKPRSTISNTSGKSERIVRKNHQKNKTIAPMKILIKVVKMTVVMIMKRKWGMVRKSQTNQSIASKSSLKIREIRRKSGKSVISLKSKEPMNAKWLSNMTRYSSLSTKISEKISSQLPKFKSELQKSKPRRNNSKTME